MSNNEAIQAMSNFYKSEISNITTETIRIIDRLNEMAELKKDCPLDWPVYSEALLTQPVNLLN